MNLRLAMMRGVDALDLPIKHTSGSGIRKKPASKC
jgi:hypothetical protein